MSLNLKAAAGLALALAAAVAIALAISIRAGGDGGARYDVTVNFDRTATQEEMEAVAAALRAFDADADMLILEIFPPIGRAIVETDAADFCSSARERLEPVHGVAGVSCRPHEADGPADPDAPVSDDATR